MEEEQKAKDEELIALRLEKKERDRADKLAKAGVPLLFKNDRRLLDAEDDKVDEVIETIKKEYQALLPNNGAHVSTNVGGTGGDPQVAEMDRMRNLGLKK